MLQNSKIFETNNYSQHYLKNTLNNKSYKVVWDMSMQNISINIDFA